MLVKSNIFLKRELVRLRNQVEGLQGRRLQDTVASYGHQLPDTGCQITLQNTRWQGYMLQETSYLSRFINKSLLM